jgi:hypothetical protein
VQHSYSDKPIGYKKKSCTVDHILTLKNIIDEYILKAPRKNIFTCFVDFKSAFDTVWRKALIYNLISNRRTFPKHTA